MYTVGNTTMYLYMDEQEYTVYHHTTVVRGVSVYSGYSLYSLWSVSVHHHTVYMVRGISSVTWITCTACRASVVRRGALSVASVQQDMQVVYMH